MPQMSPMMWVPIMMITMMMTMQTMTNLYFTKPMKKKNNLNKFFKENKWKW